MLIGILSDIHDHLPHLRLALERLADCEELICCGDLCSPFVMNALGQGYERPIHIVFGNNDGDLFRLTQNARPFENISLYGEFVDLERDGKRFAINHFDALGRALARSGAYDVVTFGHNHQFELSQEGDTLIINPGEVYGGLTGDATCVRYDTTRHTATRIDLT